MSVAIRRALYGKLAGDTTLNNLLGTPAPGFSKSIYYQLAPQGASFPYVIFGKSSGVPIYALKQLAVDNDIWMVKGVDRNTDADPVDAISDRLKTLLTDSEPSISGKTSLYLRRESDLDYEETDGDIRYLNSGALFRFVYQ